MSDESAADTATRARALAELLDRVADELRLPLNSSPQRMPLVRRLHAALRAFRGSSFRPEDAEETAQTATMWRAVESATRDLADELRSLASQLLGGPVGADQRRRLVSKLRNTKRMLDPTEPTREARLFLMECLYSVQIDLPVLRRLCGETYDKESLFSEKTSVTAVNASEFVLIRFCTRFPEYREQIGKEKVRKALVPTLRLFSRGRGGSRRGPPSNDEGVEPIVGRWDAFNELLKDAGMAGSKEYLSEGGLRTEWNEQKDNFSTRSKAFRRIARKTYELFKRSVGQDPCSRFLLTLVLDRWGRRP